MEHGEDSPYCCFHPKEKIVGVCAPCLKERLLILASKQRRQTTHEHERRSSKISKLYRMPSKSLPKVFAFGSFLHRLEIRPQKPDNFGYDTDTDTSSSNEDSFISIKFGDNGRTSWDKGRISWASSDIFELPTKKCLSKDMKVTKSCMVEHAKSRTPNLRWRKRIGHILQLVRWRRSNKGSVVHIGTKVEGGKVRKGWIKPITKRRVGE